MGDDASQPSLNEEIRQLRAIVDGLAARAEREERIGAILASAGEPPPPPRRRPAHRRQGRPHLRVIPGGLAALVPLAAHGHAAVAAVPAAHVWLSRRAWPRWAVAALALGLAGATAMPTAADVRDFGAPPCAHQCAGDGEGAGGSLVRHHRDDARARAARLPWQPMAPPRETMQS